MKTEASPQGMEVSEQREKNEKRKKKQRKSPAAGRFCNQLIDRWLKNIVWDLVEDPRETISTRNFFLEKIFNQEEVSKGKTMIKNFSNTNAELVTTIPAQKPKPEWLFKHFCSLAIMKRTGWSRSEIHWAKKTKKIH